MSTYGMTRDTLHFTSPVSLVTCKHIIAIIFILYPLSSFSEMVVLLVSHGADVNLHGGSDGWTPLLYSAMAGMRRTKHRTGVHNQL